MGKFTGHTITSDSALGDAKIQRSLRFNTADADYLNRTIGTPTSSQIFTFSCWLKTTKLDGDGKSIFLAQGSSQNGADQILTLNSDNELFFQGSDSGIYGRWESTRLIRDTSAWYHIVVKVDTTVGTNGVTFYVNNEVASGTWVTTLPQNKSFSGSANGATHHVGKGLSSYPSQQAFSGYLAEVNFIDGQALDPSYFGFTDPVTGAWMPKRYEGTYGTNGFYLDFSDNSSTASLGIDKSPNGNDFSVNNFSVAAGKENDSLEDTPSNNFCTMNSLMMNASEVAGTHSSGNLTWKSDNNYATTQATFPVTTGRWYWECEMESQYVNIAGITRGTHAAENTYIGYDTNSHLFGFGYYYNDGTVKGTTDGLGTTSNNNLATSQTTAANGDILGIASDITNGYLIFYKNGTHIYTITGISNAFDWFPSFSAYGTSATWHVNFGQRPFSYTPPAGHKSLCSKNLSPNIPSVLRPQRHFDTVLWTGNATSRDITGLEFKPDLVWIKSRSGAYHHGLFDVIRGANKVVKSSDAAVEATWTQQLMSFNDGGFSLGDNSDSGNYANINTGNYVAWCWKAGGAAVANNDGSVTSQVSVNREAGFSIVTLDGTGSVLTFGHGLGAKPSMVMLKARNIANNWLVYHESYGAEKTTFLDTATATSDNAQWYNDTEPTSSVFTLGTWSGMNTASSEIIAYCWTDIPGYSKIGGYTGNGSSNGTYVHLGFRPACIIIKNITTNTSWVIYDIKRSPINVVDEVLFPNGTSVSGTTGDNEVDFLAKGFKYRAAANKVNSGSKDYVYMAFAEQPNPTPFDSFANAR